MYVCTYIRARTQTQTRAHPHATQVVGVSECVSTHLTSALQGIRGAAPTEYADPHGTFFRQYRGLYNRFAGDSCLQAHYLGVLMVLEASRAFSMGALSSAAQPLLLSGISAVDVAWLALVRPYKSRLQNLKQLVQACLKAMLMLLAAINTSRTATPGQAYTPQPAALDALMLTVLGLSLVLDGISPLLGSLRAIIGSALIACRAHRDVRVLRHRRLNRIVNFFAGVPRQRSAMYLSPHGLRRCRNALLRLLARRCGSHDAMCLTWLGCGRSCKSTHQLRSRIRFDKELAASAMQGSDGMQGDMMDNNDAMVSGTHGSMASPRRC